MNGFPIGVRKIAYTPGYTSTTRILLSSVPQSKHENCVPCDVVRKAGAVFGGWPTPSRSLQKPLTMPHLHDLDTINLIGTGRSVRGAMHFMSVLRDTKEFQRQKQLRLELAAKTAMQWRDRIAKSFRGLTK